MTPEQFKEAAFYGVVFWGAFPSISQWIAIADDLEAERHASGGAARVWLELAEYKTVLVGGKVTDHPVLADQRGVIDSLMGATALRTIVISVPSAYPDHGGGSVGRNNTLLHERCHGLNAGIGRILYPSDPRLMSDRPEWHWVARDIPWWTGHPHAETYMLERWADAGAAYFGELSGRVYAPPEVWRKPIYNPVRDYFSTLFRRLKWPLTNPPPRFE